MKQQSKIDFFWSIGSLLHQLLRSLFILLVRISKSSCHNINIFSYPRFHFQAINNLHFFETKFIKILTQIVKNLEHKSCSYIVVALSKRQRPLKWRDNEAYSFRKQTLTSQPLKCQMFFEQNKSSIYSISRGFSSTGEKQQNFSTNKKSIEFFEIHGKQWEIENVNLEQSQPIQVQILFKKSIEYIKVNMHGKQL